MGSTAARLTDSWTCSCARRRRWVARAAARTPSSSSRWATRRASRPLGVIGRREHAEGSEVSIDSRVDRPPTDDGGFAFSVAAPTSLPQVQDPEHALELVAAAHQVCPYSNATRGNIDVALHRQRPRCRVVPIANSGSRVTPHDVGGECGGASAPAPACPPDASIPTCRRRQPGSNLRGQRHLREGSEVPSGSWRGRRIEHRITVRLLGPVDVIDATGHPVAMTSPTSLLLLALPRSCRLGSFRGSAVRGALVGHTPRDGRLGVTGTSLQVAACVEPGSRG